MRLLIVEDEELNLIVVVEMIKILFDDIDIVTVENGEEAYKLLRKDSNFDLILSDINMPVMDGYELIKKIKNELKLTIPTIAITAFAVQGDKEKLLLSGFDAYISKPIDMGELENTIKRYGEIIR